jgi:putative ABC transport system permease protein
VWWAVFKESLIMAWENIRGNKLRSFLTMLGIMIGVTSIIALITVVQGVTGQVIDQFSAMGAGKVTVQAYGNTLKAGLNENDIQTLSELESISGVSPTLTLTGSAARGGKVMEEAGLEGKNDVYFLHNPTEVVWGRGLAAGDMSGQSNVCIIDAYLAKELFFGEEVLGQQLALNGMSYTVVGVVETATSFFGQNTGRILLPYKNALQLSGDANIRSVELYLYDAEKTEEANREIEAALDAAFNYVDNSYNIVNFDSILSAMEEMQGMLTAMLGGIASIALLVGGVGIMNMMLVSVSERTQEIGLRKALGAEPGQIQQQFVIEAVMLSLLGGLLGLLLGLLISFVAAIFIGMAFSLSVIAIVLGLGFSAAVGIVFGWTPARKASRLKPIDALRTA